MKTKRAFAGLAGAVLGAALISVAVPTAGATAGQTGAASLAASEDLSWSLYNLDGGRITAGFDGYSSTSGRHEGIDIGMLRTLHLRAVTAGVVKSVGYVNGYAGYGNVVLLDLPGPYTALYAHLSRVDVKPGQRVGEGDLLGLAGCTGSCSGTHLHFEVLHRGSPVDPLRFLG